MSHSVEWYKRWKMPKIEHGLPTSWGWVVLYPENLKLGRYTDIGYFTLIDAKHIVEIGEKVQIGSHVSIYSHSTIDGTRGKVVIKRGACAGANSVVLPGVTIGEEAVVGALSLVKTDIPAGEVWGGIPARKIVYS